MNDIVPYSEYQAAYLDLITWQHQKPKYRDTVALTVWGPTELQALLARMPGLFDIDTAVGQQLDVLGQWIGVTRFIDTLIENVYFSWDADKVGWETGLWWKPYESAISIARLDDEHYRLVLKARIAANSWDGTIPGAYEAWNTLFEDSDYHIIIQNGMAAAATSLTWDGEARQGWNKSVWTRYLQQRTNFIRNSAGHGARVGGNQLPTYWNYNSNWLFQIVELLVRDDLDIVHIHFYGATGEDESYLWFDAYDYLTLHPADTNDWTFSLYFHQYFPVAQITALYVDLVAYDSSHGVQLVKSTQIYPQSEWSATRYDVTMTYRERPVFTKLLRPRLRMVHTGGVNLDPPQPHVVTWSSTASAPTVVIQGSIITTNTDNQDQAAIVDTPVSVKTYAEFIIGRMTGTGNTGFGVVDSVTLQKPATTAGWWIGQDSSFGWYDTGWVATDWNVGETGNFQYFQLDTDPSDGLDFSYWDGTPASYPATPFPSFHTGDIVSLAIDPLNRRFWCRVNGGAWNNDPIADPENNIGGWSLAHLGLPLWIGATIHTAGDSVQGLFPQSSWFYRSPFGFNSLQIPPPEISGYDIAVAAPQLEIGTEATKWISTSGSAEVVYDRTEEKEARLNGPMHMIYGLFAPYASPPPPPNYFSWDNFDYFAWDQGFADVHWEMAYASEGMMVHHHTMAQATLHDTYQSIFTCNGFDYPYYLELFIEGSGDPRVGLGDSTVVMNPGNKLGWYLGQDNSVSWNGSDGSVWVNGQQVATWETFGDGDTLSLAIDPATNLFWGRVSGGDWNDDPQADPTAKVNGVSIALLSGIIFVGLTLWDETDMVTAHFVPEEWLYTAPTGFAALEHDTIDVHEGWDYGLWDKSLVTTDPMGWNNGVWDTTPSLATPPIYDAVTMALFTGGYLDMRPAGVMIEYCIQSQIGGPFFGWDTSEPIFGGLEYFSWDDTALTGWEVGVWDGTVPAYVAPSLTAPPTFVAGWGNGSWANFVEPTKYAPTPAPSQLAA